jgi:hypothetical protein
MNLIGVFGDCTNAPNNDSLSHNNPLKSSDNFSFNTQISAFFSPHITLACCLWLSQPTDHYFYLGVFTNVWLKPPFFCDKTMRHLLTGYRHFEATYRRRFQGHIEPKVIKMTALYSLRMSGNHYALRQHRVPEMNPQPLFPYRAFTDWVS